MVFLAVPGSLWLWRCFLQYQGPIILRRVIISVLVLLSHNVSYNASQVSSVVPGSLCLVSCTYYWPGPHISFSDFFFSVRVHLFPFTSLTVTGFHNLLSSARDPKRHGAWRGCLRGAEARLVQFSQADLRLALYLPTAGTDSKDTCVIVADAVNWYFYYYWNVCSCFFSLPMKSLPLLFRLTPLRLFRAFWTIFRFKVAKNTLWDIASWNVTEKTGNVCLDPEWPLLDCESL